MPEREVVAAAAVATATQDMRPKSSQQWRLFQSLALGPLVSRTRACVEKQGPREARLESGSWPPQALPSFLVQALETAALVPLLGCTRLQARRVQRWWWQERGSHLVEDSTLAEALSWPFLSDTLAMWPLRCGSSHQWERNL